MRAQNVDGPVEESDFRRASKSHLSTRDEIVRSTPISSTSFTGGSSIRIDGSIWRRHVGDDGDRRDAALAHDDCHERPLPTACRSLDASLPFSLFLSHTPTLDASWVVAHMADTALKNSFTRHISIYLYIYIANICTYVANDSLRSCKAQSGFVVYEMTDVDGRTIDERRTRSARQGVRLPRRGRVLVPPAIHDTHAKDTFATSVPSSSR